MASGTDSLPDQPHSRLRGAWTRRQTQLRRDSRPLAQTTFSVAVAFRPGAAELAEKVAPRRSAEARAPLPASLWVPGRRVEPLRRSNPWSRCRKVLRRGLAGRHLCLTRLR